MNITRHGLSIGIERAGSTFFLKLTAIGKLQHSDYEVIVPMLESALAGVEDPRITALVDTTECQGWELRAAWDDLKLGLKHGREFSRVAIVGSKPWQKWLASIGSWFIAGDVEYFEDTEAALHWLGALN